MTLQSEVAVGRDDVTGHGADGVGMWPTRSGGPPG
jgi:hypothetical protein